MNPLPPSQTVQSAVPTKQTQPSQPARTIAQEKFLQELARTNPALRDVIATQLDTAQRAGNIGQQQAHPREAHTVLPASDLTPTRQKPPELSVLPSPRREHSPRSPTRFEQFTRPNAFQPNQPPRRPLFQDMPRTFTDPDPMPPPFIQPPPSNIYTYQDARRTTQDQAHPQSHLPDELDQAYGRPARPESISPNVAQGIMTGLQQIMELMQQHHPHVSTRQASQADYIPAVHTQQPYMTGANGSGIPQLSNPRPYPMRENLTMDRRTGYNDDPPYPRFTSAGSAPPRHSYPCDNVHTQRAQSAYPMVNRGLTPEETRIADDNAKVKAMGGSLKFSPEQIGYFWPDMPQSDYADDVAEISGRTHFRNVRDFTDAAKMVIASQTMAEHTVRNNLQQCLKGTALLWYQSSLDLGRRLDVIGGTGIDRWEAKLKPFRVQPAVAMKQLQQERFTPRDLTTGRSPAEWFLRVKRLC